MGLLERWDDRNQETMEEANRLHKAGETGVKGGLGGLGAYGLGKLLLWVMPWSFRIEMGIILGVAGLLFMGGFIVRRRRQSETSGPDPVDVARG